MITYAQNQKIGVHFDFRRARLLATMSTKAANLENQVGQLYLDENGVARFFTRFGTMHTKVISAYRNDNRLSIRSLNSDWIFEIDV